MVRINITLILLAMSIVFLGVVAYLYYIERDIKKKIIKHQDLSQKYKLKMSSLKKSKKKTEKAIKELDELAKEFLKESLKVSSEKDYPELQKEFSKKGNKDIAEFCEKMTEVYYVKDNPKKEDLKELIEKFEVVIENHKIRNKNEKDSIDKINSFLRERFISRVK